MYQARAKNASIHFIASTLRSKKNKTLVYLDSMDYSTKESNINFAIPQGRKAIRKSREQVEALRKELSLRQAQKRQKRDERSRSKVEKMLKSTKVEKIAEKFPDLDGRRYEWIEDILTTNGRKQKSNLCYPN